jgi:hypothetical protein
VDAVHRLTVGEPGAVTGRFFDRTRETTANAQAYDENARRELWLRSLELVGHPGID